MALTLLSLAHQIMMSLNAFFLSTSRLALSTDRLSTTTTRHLSARCLSVFCFFADKSRMFFYRSYFQSLRRVVVTRSSARITIPGNDILVTSRKSRENSARRADETRTTGVCCPFFLLCYAGVYLSPRSAKVNHVYRCIYTLRGWRSRARARARRKNKTRDILYFSVETTRSRSPDNATKRQVRHLQATRIGGYGWLWPFANLRVWISFSRPESFALTIFAESRRRSCERETRVSERTCEQEDKSRKVRKSGIAFVHSPSPSPCQHVFALSSRLTRPYSRPCLLERLSRLRQVAEGSRGKQPST